MDDSSDCETRFHIVNAPAGAPAGLRPSDRPLLCFPHGNTSAQLQSREIADPRRRHASSTVAHEVAEQSTGRGTPYRRGFDVDDVDLAVEDQADLLELLDVAIAALGHRPAQ